MADEATTTTSTVDETTTTTSTTPVSDANQNQSQHKPEDLVGTVTDTSTVTASASVTSTGDDLASDVKSPTTNDVAQTQDERLDQARATALHNHAIEHADDPVTSSSDPTVV